MMHNKITNLIKQVGPIGIDIFMSMVIPYYYGNNIALGAKGDFITAPEISQMFGEILGVWLINNWQQSGSKNLSIIELGPGRATLMRDLLKMASRVKGFQDNLKRIYLLESSESLMQEQKKALKEYNFNIIWVKDLSEIKVEKNEHIFFIANEFFDCLPIKQYIKTKEGSLHEILVTSRSDGGLYFMQGPAITIQCQEKEYGSSFLDSADEDKAAEQGILEVCPAYSLYTSQIAEICRSASNAQGVIIDYGYLERPLKSSLQAVYRHNKIDPLQKIGQADITALVDFKALAELFERGDMRCQITDQALFLQHHGIEQRSLQLKAANPEQASNIEAQLIRLIGDGEANMGGLFKVLEFSSQ